MAQKSNERLAVRRRRHRRRFLVAWLILLLAVVALVFYGLWRPQMRVSQITVYGADQSLSRVAAEAMQGSFFGVPDNSIFIVPENRIRSRILATDPSIAAVSISRTGFTSISIKVDHRNAIARWCGTSSASTIVQDAPVKEIVSNSSDACYFFDASGFVYATVTPDVNTQSTVFGPVPTASSTAAMAAAVVTAPAAAPRDVPATSFVLFDTLTSTTATPITNTLAHADKLPSVFDFARRVASFGAPVNTIVIRGDEVDFFLKASGVSSTTARITYLLGDEVSAFAALTAARVGFNLGDGSVQYIDLRFPGKVYVKKNTQK